MIGFSLEEQEAIRKLIEEESPIASAIKKYIQYKIDRYNKQCDTYCHQAMTDELSLIPARAYAAQAKAMSSFFPDLERELQVLDGPTVQGDDNE